MLIISYAPDDGRIRCVRLDITSLEPEGLWDLYRPDLTYHDDPLSNMLLLCQQCERESDYIYLPQVPREHTVAVVSQLQAFYQRMRLVREQTIGLRLALTPELTVGKF